MVHRYLFDGLSVESLERLTHHSTPLTFSDGELLFLADSHGSCAYRLESGTVRLFLSTPEGREVTIHLVQPGELFAETVLFERDEYPASAVAVGDVRVLSISKARVHELLREDRFREEFLTNLVQKMRYLSEQMYVLATLDVEQRLLRFLEVRYGRRESIIVDLTKGEVAAALSVRPETLSRTIRALTEAGKITWSHKTIRIAPEVWTE